MNDKDLKPETVAEPDDETADSDDIAPADRRQGLRRSGLDRRDPTAGTFVSRTGEKTATAGLKGDVKKTPSDPSRNWAAGLEGAGECRARCRKK